MKRFRVKEHFELAPSMYARVIKLTSILEQQDSTYDGADTPASAHTAD